MRRPQIASYNPSFSDGSTHRVDRSQDPTGGASPFRFTWAPRASADERGASQSAYRLVVVDERRAGDGGAVQFDSGVVRSDNPAANLARDALAADGAFLWTVEWFDANGRGAGASRAARLRTALRAADWADPVGRLGGIRLFRDYDGDADADGDDSGALGGEAAWLGDNSRCVSPIGPRPTEAKKEGAPRGGLVWWWAPPHSAAPCTSFVRDLATSTAASCGFRRCRGRPPPAAASGT